MILRRRHGYPWYLTLLMFALVLGMFVFLEYHLLNIAHATEEREWTSTQFVTSYYVRDGNRITIVDEGFDCPEGYVSGKSGQWIEIPSQDDQAEFSSDESVLRLCVHDVYDPMQLIEYSGACQVCVWESP
ncbi:MAG: hypothetical protein O2794_03425 [bacterium]|nr:hypothetical protein [bacterium]